MSDMGVRTVKSFVNEDQRWIAPETAREIASGARQRRGITLEMNLFSRVTFPNNLIPSGIVLGQVTATKRFAPYDDAAVNGLQVARLFLYATVEWDAAFTANGRIPAAGLPGGAIVEAFLPTGHGLDAAARVDLASKFDFIA
jgi:hypothetical protein